VANGCTGTEELWCGAECIDSRASLDHCGECDQDCAFEFNAGYCRRRRFTAEGGPHADIGRSYLPVTVQVEESSGRQIHVEHSMDVSTLVDYGEPYCGCVQLELDLVSPAGERWTF
jgi:hypothetical protein